MVSTPVGPGFTDIRIAGILLIVDITQPLKEKHAQDVVLEVSGINAASENISRFPQVELEFLESKFFRHSTPFCLAGYIGL